MNGRPAVAAERIELDGTFSAGDPATAVAWLAARSGLPKARIKDAMSKGAVALLRPGSTSRRLRRATTALRPGDRLRLHYDPRLLAETPAEARLIADRRRYSVWYKPAGLLAQGTEWGDHCSLPRQAELRFGPERPTFVVHRLDREADGLTLLAHDRQAAAALSALFREDRVDKRYRVQVLGCPGGIGQTGAIDTPLDGKPARTEYRVVACGDGRAELAVTLHGGSLHQIRRHLAALGHPVLGDPRYGHGNRDPGGLRLSAVGLGFRDPFGGGRVEFSLEPQGTESA